MDLDLFIVFPVSVLSIHLDFSNDLTLSVLLLLSVFTALLDACDFYVLLTASIFFFLK